MKNAHLIALLASSILVTAEANAVVRRPLPPPHNDTHTVDANHNDYFIRQLGGSSNNASSYSFNGAHNYILRTATGSNNSFKSAVTGNYSSSSTQIIGNNNKMAPINRSVTTTSGLKNFSATNDIRGNYVRATQNILGNNNVVASEINAGNSSTLQNVRGSNNISGIKDVGNGNGIVTEIGYAFYSTSTVSVNTANNNNVLLADVKGNSNGVEAYIQGGNITSSASNNSLYLSVVGNRNAVRAKQIGNGNEMAVMVNGNDNKLITPVRGHPRHPLTTPLTFAQTGNNNLMRVTVNGNGNGGTISQIGNNLTTTAVYNVSGHKF